MMYRCRWHTGLKQLHPATVCDLVVRRGGDGYSPAEVMGNSETHTSDSVSLLSLAPSVAGSSGATPPPATSL
jgi:hypothetical protein